MNQQDKQELQEMMIHTFNLGFEQVVLPMIQEIRADVSELKSDMGEVKETLDDHTIRLDRMERILRAETKTLDEHNARLKRIEKHIGLR